MSEDEERTWVMIECPKCKEQFGSYLHFCPYCGEKNDSPLHDEYWKKKQ